MKQYLGLRNAVISKKDWKYLLFYERDTENESDAYAMKDVYDRFPTSYIIYKTKHGYQAVGMTPLNALEWGSYYQILTNKFGEYYIGQTIRMSMKSEEKQELFGYNFNYPYVVKLMNFYANRFKIPVSEIPVYGAPPPYDIIEEKYWSEKD